MNVFHKFTRHSLLKNRTRTVVTIIGIVLSMAMFTAVTEIAGSLQSFLERKEIEQDGAFHGIFLQLDEEQKEKVIALREISDTAVWQTVGWAEIGSENEFKPYLLVRSVDEDFTNLAAVHILQGRMPQNEYEILLPEHLESNGGVRYKIGDTLTLRIGERSIAGETVGETTPYGGPDITERLQNTETKKYTVVGICGRLSTKLESYDCPGYTALTYGGGKGNYDVLFTLKRPSGFYKFMSDQQSITDKWVAHEALLRAYGSLRSDSLRFVLYGFAGVLLFLISFGSVALIYNSFSISVSERIRQFGLLRSVGATSAQIRSCVLYEAMLLSAIGIPVGMLAGCAGIGVTLWALRDQFMKILPSSDAVRLKLVLRPDALLIAAVICLITTLISALIPAIRARRVAPIDAIRQTKQTRIRSKEVRTPRIIFKLFGFEGLMAAKNFRRDRKRYRATVASLFLSVTLFVTASSFCVYLNDSAFDVTGGEMSADVVVQMTDRQNVDAGEILSVLSDDPEITESACYELVYRTMYVPADTISKEYKDTPFYGAAAEKNGEATVWAQIVFLDDQAFSKLCKAHGATVRKYFDKSIPQALVYNKTANYMMDEGVAKDRWYVYKTFDPAAFPFTARCEITKQIDGYMMVKDDGQDLLYYPKEYLSEVRYGEGNSELDESRALRIDRSQAVIKQTLRLGMMIEKMPFCLDSNGVTLIYPYSLKGAVLTDETMGQDDELSTYFAFLTSRHSEACQTLADKIGTYYPEADYELSDLAEMRESMRALLWVINVFSYGFIILISLIAASNVFNTISTNIALRRREFAMLRSVGLSPKGFRRMMNYECVIYGARGLFWGLIAATGLTYLIYKIVAFSVVRDFYMPWPSVAIAAASVFLVVFSTMLYATYKIRKDNPIDALKNENL